MVEKFLEIENPTQSKDLRVEGLQWLDPDRLQLCIHHIPISGIYWRCKKDWGNIDHIYTLIFCDVVWPFWKTMCYWGILSKNCGRDFHDLMEVVFRVTGRERFQVWLIMVWMLWKELCDAKHVSKLVCWTSIHNGTHAFVDQFIMARTTPRPTLPWKRRIGGSKWVSPPPGSFHLDVDALFNPNTEKYGVGAIVRNDMGRHLLALAKLTGRIRSVLEADLIVMLYGIGFCLQHALIPVHIYTDSFVPVQVLKKYEE